MGHRVLAVLECDHRGVERLGLGDDLPRRGQQVGQIVDRAGQPPAPPPGRRIADTVFAQLVGPVLGAAQGAFCVDQQPLRVLGGGGGQLGQLTGNAHHGGLRVAGITPDGASRRVSLHDGDARPIRKGRLGKPVEFGHKGQVVDNDDGIVLDHSVERGNPPDAGQLAPAVKRVTKRAGRTPRTVTADRGYGEAALDRELTDLRVANVVIPRKGKTTQARRAIEHRKAFRRTVKWRTGSEGRISHLKRGYGWDRTRIDGTQGARIWTGHGVFAHNLAKISALAA